MSQVSKSIIKGALQSLANGNGNGNGKKIKLKAHKIIIPKEVDVRAIRKYLDLDRKEFCELFGFSLRTIEKWEQGIRQPEGPARAYLMVIAKDPQAVVHALSKN